MNKLTIIFLFVFIFSNSLIAQLVVGENASVTVAESASITVAGLEINPNSDMVISGPNSVDRNLTSVAIDGAESMARHYTISDNLSSYTGAVVYNYVDDDMNGITHFAALQVLMRMLMTIRSLTLLTMLLKFIA